jgi:4-amino-4-deoxy-L-arabinose transferase-like glycosyltransferase
MRLPRLAFILVFWLGALTVSVSTYNIINDHFDRISRARQIARYGELPFRDFFDPGYFMTEFTSAGLQLLLGDSLLGEMLLNTVFIATGATLVFVVARRVSDSDLGGLAAALLALFAMPRAYDFDKVLFYPLGIFLCWRYVDRPGARRALELAAGITIGALFRYDTGIYTGLAAVVTMLVLHWREPKVCAQRIGLCGFTPNDVSRRCSCASSRVPGPPATQPHSSTTFSGACRSWR